MATRHPHKSRQNTLTLSIAIYLIAPINFKYHQYESFVINFHICPCYISEHKNLPNPPHSPNEYSCPILFDGWPLGSHPRQSQGRYGRHRRQIVYCMSNTPLRSPIPHIIPRRKAANNARTRLVPNNLATPILPNAATVANIISPALPSFQTLLFQPPTHPSSSCSYSMISPSSIMTTTATNSQTLIPCGNIQQSCWLIFSTSSARTSSCKSRHHPCQTSSLARTEIGYGCPSVQIHSATISLLEFLY